MIDSSIFKNGVRIPNDEYCLGNFVKNNYVFIRKYSYKNNECSIFYKNYYVIVVDNPYLDVLSSFMVSNIKEAKKMFEVYVDNGKDVEIAKTMTNCLLLKKCISKNKQNIMEGENND